MLSSGFSSLAASLATTANMAASTAQLHAAVLSHSVHLPKRVSQLWSHVAYDSQPSALSKAPLDLDAALRTAVARNSVETLRLLLDYGANLHAMDADAHSILYLAASAGHAAMTAELLLRGARATPEMLEMAIGRHHTSVVKLLLPYVAPTFVHVHDAIDANAPPALLQALVATMEDVDAMLDNLSPLMRAAFKGHAHLCDVLLDANADVFAENEDGDTALHFACRAGHMHATYVLLQAGADMDMPNVDDESPFEVASPHLTPLLDCNGVVDEAIVLQWQHQLTTRGCIIPAGVLKKRAAKYGDLPLTTIAEEEGN